MSGGSPPSAGVHDGSRWSWSRAAACAHWSLRCAVGATITTGAGRLARTWRRAVCANVVLPAPGVATARKSGCGEAEKRARAACCQGRSLTLRDMGPLCGDGAGWPVSHEPARREVAQAAGQPSLLENVSNETAESRLPSSSRPVLRSYAVDAT